MWHFLGSTNLHGECILSLWRLSHLQRHMCLNFTSHPRPTFIIVTSSSSLAVFYSHIEHFIHNLQFLSMSIRSLSRLWLSCWITIRLHLPMTYGLNFNLLNISYWLCVKYPRWIGWNVESDCFKPTYTLPQIHVYVWTCICLNFVSMSSTNCMMRCGIF